MKKINIFSAILLFSFLVNTNGQTIKSTIVEADGFAYLSEDKAIKDIRREALSNAKREALEKAKTYIESFSQVENFKLTEDIIKTSAEGFVKILDSKDIGITNKNRYHYWIKAEIEYDFNHDIKQLAEKKLPLSLQIWTSQKEYFKNEKIIIFVKGDKDFYANILYQDASSKIFQILPNQFKTNNFFMANKTYQIPSSNDNFELIVSEPFGIEKIIIYASNSELGEVKVRKHGNYFYQLETTEQIYANQTRGLKIRKKIPSDFIESKIIIKTKNYD